MGTDTCLCFLAGKETPEGQGAVRGWLGGPRGRGGRRSPAGLHQGSENSRNQVNFPGTDKASRGIHWEPHGGSAESNMLTEGQGSCDLPEDTSPHPRCGRTASKGRDHTLSISVGCLWPLRRSHRSVERHGGETEEVRGGCQEPLLLKGTREQEFQAWGGT